MDKAYAYEVKLTPQPIDLRRLKKTSLELGLKEAKIIAKKYSRLEDTIFGFML